MTLLFVALITILETKAFQHEPDNMRILWICTEEKAKSHTWNLFLEIFAANNIKEGCISNPNLYAYLHWCWLKTFCHPKHPSYVPPWLGPQQVGYGSNKLWYEPEALPLPTLPPSADKDTSSCCLGHLDGELAQTRFLLNRLVYTGLWFTSLLKENVLQMNVWTNSTENHNTLMMRSW